MSEVVRVDVRTATLTCLVDGPAGGPVVLCVHGFPDSPLGFRDQVGALAGAGYRVVAPYTRGYAPSSIGSDGRYDAETLAGDLCALALHFSKVPVRLVGHDWGAIAAYAATALAPRLFSRVCTLAVPHLRVAAARWATRVQLRRSWYMGLFQIRLVAENRLSADNFALVDRLWRDWSPGWTPPPGELDAVKACFREPAHLKAVLGYYRALASPRELLGLGSQGRRLLFARTSVAAIYVHGVDDGCVGVELAEGVESAYSGPIAVHRLAGGHFVHRENPTEFNTLLLDFLK